MKILVLGGVAAGTKAAAKLMREDRSNEVLILNKGSDISYAGCGLPYYVGHVIEDRAQLIVNTPAKFEALTGAQVCTGTEATHVDREQKTVTAVDLATGTETVYPYDKLVIATGASPVQPPIAGVELGNVFFMRTPQDAEDLRALVDSGSVKKAVVVGAGYIGLEIAENLAARGVKPFVLDMAPHVLPGFDPEFATYIEGKLSEAGIPVVTGVKVTGLEGEDGKVKKVLTDKKGYKCDLVVLSAGIRPNTAFLNDTGLEMFKGTLLTDELGRPTIPTSTPWATAPWSATPSPARPPGLPWAPRPTSRAAWWPRISPARPGTTAAPWAPPSASCPDSTWAAPVSPRTRLRPRALTPSASSPSWTTRPTICPGPAASSSS